jgi:hypothetical protein
MGRLSHGSPPSSAGQTPSLRPPLINLRLNETRFQRPQNLKAYMALFLKNNGILCQNRTKNFSLSLKTLLPKGHRFLIIINQHRLEDFSLRSFYGLFSPDKTFHRETILNNPMGEKINLLTLLAEGQEAFLKMSQSPYGRT